MNTNTQLPQPSTPASRRISWARKFILMYEQHRANFSKLLSQDVQNDEGESAGWARDVSTLIEGTQQLLIYEVQAKYARHFITVLQTLPEERHEAFLQSFRETLQREAEGAISEYWSGPFGATTSRLKSQAIMELLSPSGFTKSFLKSNIRSDEA